MYACALTYMHTSARSARGGVLRCQPTRRSHIRLRHFWGLNPSCRQRACRCRQRSRPCPPQRRSLSTQIHTHTHTHVPVWPYMYTYIAAHVFRKGGLSLRGCGYSYSGGYGYVGGCGLVWVGVRCVAKGVPILLLKTTLVVKDSAEEVSVFVCGWVGGWLWMSVSVGACVCVYIFINTYIHAYQYTYVHIYI